MFARTRFMKPILFSLVLMGLVLRIFLTLHYVDLANPQLWEFGQIARNFVNTGVYSYNNPGVATAFMPPGFVLIIAFFYKIFGVGIAAHCGIAIVLWVFEISVPLLLGWMVSKVWDKTAGIVALLIALYWPMFLIMSGRLHSIPVNVALLILACGIMFSNKPTLPVKAVLVGLVLGLYANFRFDACMFLIPFGYYVFREKIGVSWPVVSKLRIVVAMFACFLLGAAPWLMRNYKVFGEFTLGTTRGHTLLIGHNANATGTTCPHWDPNRKNANELISLPTGVDPHETVFETPQDELRADKHNVKEAIKFARNNLGREVELAFYKAYYFLIADFTHPIGRRIVVWLPSLVALVLGAYFFIRGGLRDSRQQTLWLVFLVQLGITVAFCVLPRRRMLVDFVPLAFFAAWLGSLLSSLLPYFFPPLFRGETSPGVVRK